MKLGPLLALLVGLLFTSAAKADDRDRLGAFVPDHATLLAREATRLEDRIAHLLATQPGVTRAEAVVSLVDVSRAPLDAPVAAPHVTLLIESEAEALSDAQLAALIRALSARLTRAAVSVVRTAPRAAAAPEPRLVEVGPFLVAAASAPWVRAGFSALLLSNIALAVLLLTRKRSH